MPIIDVHRNTYFERMNATLKCIQDQQTKELCTELLAFLKASHVELKRNVIDLTDKTVEDAVTAYLAKDPNFFERTFDKFAQFTRRSLGDLMPREYATNNLNLQRSLMQTIEQHSYQILCLCALYSPLEVQKAYVVKLASVLHEFHMDSSFDVAHLTAWTALLLLINPVKLKQQCIGDGSAEIFAHFTTVLDSNISSTRNQGTERWKNLCLKGTVQLAFGISLKYARNSLGLVISRDLVDIDFVDAGLKNMALEFLHAYIVQFPIFFEFPFSIDVLDSILKNFISYFRDKTAELYNMCEEELYSLMENDNSSKRTNYYSSDATSPGSRVPNFANLHFKTMLELIAALYEPRNIQLVQLSREFSDLNCEALGEFVKCGRAISAPALKVAYLSMLTSLCKSTESAAFFFNLFK